MSFGRRLMQLNAYDRHKLLVNQYLLTKKGDTSKLQRDTSNDRRDIDVIREHHKFLWTEQDGAQTWEEKLARKYYDKLFKEYCICDLSRYKENKVALRWRVENEVVSGKGQFECGHKPCVSRDQLTTWEVNFGYREAGEKKNALVKLRLCVPCSHKLNYHHKKREVKRQKRKLKHKHDKPSPEPVHSQSESSSINIDQSESNEAGQAGSSVEVDEAKVWKETSNPVEEKSRDKEFEEYFEDLFL